MLFTDVDSVSVTEIVVHSVDIDRPLANVINLIFSLRLSIMRLTLYCTLFHDFIANPLHCRVSYIC